MVQLDDWRIREQEDYLKNKTLYLHKYEPRSEKDEHAHCEFCWEKFSVYEGTSHVGYSTLDDMFWICDQCFNDFFEMFSFQLWDPKEFIDLEIQSILNREIGCSKGQDNIYRVDRVLRLLSKLQQIDTFKINGKIALVIIDTFLQRDITNQVKILTKSEIEIRNGTISNLQTAIYKLKHDVKEDKIEIRNDNTYIKYTTIS